MTTTKQEIDRLREDNAMAVDKDFRWKQIQEISVCPMTRSAVFLPSSARWER